MKKELTIAAKFDTSDFDKSVDSMQKRLKDLYQPADMIRQQTMQQSMMTGNRLQSNGMGGLDGASMETFKKATQAARRELDQLINQQVKSQNGLGKELYTQLDTLQKLKSSQKDMVSGSTEELKVKRQIQEVEKTTWMMREQYKNKDQNINKLLDTRDKSSPQGIDRLMNAYRGGGIGGMATAGGRMISQMPGGAMGFAGGALGWAGAAMQAGGALYRDYSRVPVDIAQAQGSAVQNTIGKDLGNVYSGRTGFDSIFMAERQRAAAKALEAYKGGRTADVLGVGGMAAGAVGAGIGAFAGGPIGAGVVGGIAATGVGVYNMVTNQRSRDAVLSMVSDRYKGRYDADRASGYAQDFRSTYEAEQNRNPVKKYAGEEFERNMGRNLQAQRAMGLTNDQFVGNGGYLQGITNAGFTHEMGINASNDILGAGGSARMAKDSGFSLQMQRMGVTNSADVLGKLSGSIQSPEASKRATIAIMSEAMKIGLDQSDFSEENRRFIGSAAAVISRTGASGEKDQDRISAMLGQFLGEKTNQGVSSAQNSYEASQSRGSQLDGRRGTLRMVEAMKNPTLAKLGQNDLSELLGTRPEDLNENNPELAAFARKAGVKPGDIVDAVSGVNKAGRYELPGQRKDVDAASSRITDYMKKNNLSKSAFGDLASKNQLPSDVMADFGDLQIAQRRTEAGAYNRANATSAAGEELPNNEQGPEKSLGKTLKDSVSAMLTTATRREDKFVQGQAGDSEVVRKNFSEMSGEIDKAAESASKMTTAVREMAIEFSNAIDQAEKNKNPAPMDALIKKQSQLGAQNQPQGGKSKQ